MVVKGKKGQQMCALTSPLEKKIEVKALKKNLTFQRQTGLTLGNTGSHIDRKITTVSKQVTSVSNATRRSVAGQVMPARG